MEISVKLQKDFCGEQAIRATEFVEFCIDHYLIIGLNHLHIAGKKKALLQIRSTQPVYRPA